jgi:hypothetical protein
MSSSFTRSKALAPPPAPPPTCGEKRPRQLAAASDEGGAPSHALFSCFDEPEKLVEVDVALVEHFGARLAGLVRHQAPALSEDGRTRFWRAGMTRAMLITVIKSLTLGQLTLCKGVTVGEALAQFEYEGISVSAQRGQHAIDAPRAGVAHTKRSERYTDTLNRRCEQVADAIVSWPRLEMALDVAAGGAEQAVASRALGNAQSFSCTGTRAWVRFADRPKQPEPDSPVLQLVLKCPRWFSEGLVSVGVVHARIARADALFGAQRDQSAFKRLTAEIEGDPFGCFFGVRGDCHRKCHDARLRKDTQKGERFASEVRRTITEHEARGNVDAPKPTHVQYAEAIATFVENVLITTPLCGLVFSAACADDKGETPERNALKRALKARGVGIVRWVEEREPNVRPLVFPPNWRDGTHASCYGPAVLLDFEKLR